MCLKLTNEAIAFSVVVLGQMQAMQNGTGPSLHYFWETPEANMLAMTRSFEVEQLQDLLWASNYNIPNM